MHAELRRAVDGNTDFGSKGSKARVARWTASELEIFKGGNKLIAKKNKV